MGIAKTPDWKHWRPGDEDGDHKKFGRHDEDGDHKKFGRHDEDGDHKKFGRHDEDGDHKKYAHHDDGDHTKHGGHDDSCEHIKPPPCDPCAHQPTDGVAWNQDGDTSDLHGALASMPATAAVDYAIDHLGSSEAPLDMAHFDTADTFHHDALA